MLIWEVDAVGCSVLIISAVSVRVSSPLHVRWMFREQRRAIK